MKCRVCAGLMEARVTDLPFKIGDASIVILKSLPVLECRQCGEIELDDATMLRVDQLLAAVAPVRRAGAKAPTMDAVGGTLENARRPVAI